MRTESPQIPAESIEARARERLDSWKEIAAYLRRDVRTLRRWEKWERLPVHRHVHRKLATVYAYKSEIDAWWSTRLPLLEQDEEHRTAGRRRRLIAAGVTAFAILVAVGMWWVRRPQLMFQERDWVLITAFENRTGEPLFDGTLEHALERELSHSRFANVVPTERVQDALRLMKKPLDTPLSEAVGREICLRDGGIRALLAGRVEKLGSVYVLSVKVVDAGSGAAVASRSEEAVSTEELSRALRLLSNGVREALGEELPRIARKPEELEPVSTPSLRALRLYTQGMALVNQAKWEPAAELLRGAVAEDSEFASAHNLLAWALWNLGKPEVEWRAHHDRAFSLADRAVESERYFILGSYYHRVHDVEKALPYYEALLRLHPDHYWGAWNLASAFLSLGRNHEAAAYLARCADLRPKNFDTNLYAALALAIWDADLAQAGSYVARARELATPDSIGLAPHEVAWAELFSAHERWVQGDLAGTFEEVMRVAESLESRSGLEAEVFASRVANFYLTLGKLKEAEELCQSYSEDSCLADVALARSDEQALRKHWTRSLKSPSPKGLGTLVVGVRAGLLVEAKELLSSLERGGYPECISSVARGELDFARGQGRQAIPLLERCVPLLRWKGLGSYFLATESLADAWEHEGEPVNAIRALEEASRERRRAYPLSDGSMGWVWMRVQWKLAESYRKVGREGEARQTESELLRLLALADPDHPMRVELERRHGAPQ